MKYLIISVALIFVFWFGFFAAPKTPKSTPKFKYHAAITEARSNGKTIEDDFSADLSIALVLLGVAYVVVIKNRRD